MGQEELEKFDMRLKRHRIEGPHRA
jgi:hypothetical protein